MGSQPTELRERPGAGLLLGAEVMHVLQDEDPATAVAADARRWIVIYRELIALHSDLLGRARELVSRAPSTPPAASLVTDVAVLEEQIARYRTRLEFWYDRQWTLEGLRLDRQSRTLSHGERSVTLTKREFQLLETLAHRPGSYLPSRQLVVIAWRDPDLPEETLRTYIVRLRAKLAALDAGLEVENRRGHGYALRFSGQASVDRAESLATPATAESRLAADPAAEPA